MKKTALQQLIDSWEERKPNGSYGLIWQAFIDEATELLETERNQIEEAFKQSRKRISILGESEIQMTDYLIQAKFQDAKQYYKDTYGFYVKPKQHQKALK